MAKLFSDGFDCYAAIADAAQGHWDSSATWSINTSGRFTGSQCLAVGTNINLTMLSKATGSNDAVIFVNVAFKQTTALALAATNGSGIVLFDGTTAQCTIFFQSNGNILIRSGTTTGSTLATYSSAFAQNTWAHFQIKATINNLTGRVQIRKDGASSDSFDSGSINTRGGTANNYANRVDITLGTTTTIGNTQFYDDVYIFNNTGAVPNDWTGDIKCKCAYPTADTAQKDFSVSLAQSVTVAGQATNINPVTTTVYLSRFTTAPTVNSVLSSLTWVPAATNASVKTKLAIYDSSFNLVGTSNEVTGTVLNVGQVYTFTPITLTAGAFYWVGFRCDTVVTSLLNAVGAGGSTGVGLSSGAYSTGFPVGPLAPSNTNSPSGITGTLVPAGNYTQVSELLEDGDTTYNLSSTVSARDLYGITYTDIPGTIIDVTQRAFMKKSSSGTRNGQLVQKAGGGSHTVTLGTDTVESSSYTWHRLDGPLNPDTGLAWTPSEVAALQIGQQVSA